MVRGWILTEREEFDKHFMKYKKPEMCDWMWKIREKNRVLRETFEGIVDIKTYRQHEKHESKDYDWLYHNFKAAIANYLGEKVQ
jgi:hypothetical protein